MCRQCVFSNGFCLLSNTIKIQHFYYMKSLRVEFDENSNHREILLDPNKF